MSTQFISIWPIDKTLSGATTMGQSEPGSHDPEWVISIPESYKITRTFLLDCFVSYSWYSLEGILPLCKKQSVYNNYTTGTSQLHPWDVPVV